MGNTDGRAFSLETDPYIRVREVMEKAFDSFLEKKHKQRLEGTYVPGSLPEAKKADGIGCLVS